MKCVEDPAKPSTIEFDFLGKDSVQYQKELEVHPAVFKNIARWTKETARGKRECPHPLAAAASLSSCCVLHACTPHPTLVRS